jgi:MYXO-CTERM domain-containing protein
LQCTLLDCRGAPGAAGAACWDLNTNAICDQPEDRNGDLVCNVLDCRGRDGLDCWDTDSDYVCDPGEDRNGDLDCTTADCQGPSGVQCWDLDSDGSCDVATEDFTSEGACTVLDCRGDNTQTGLSCWDGNMNRVCDGSEDVNGDLACNVVDCRGVPGPPGTPGQDGSDGEDGADGENGSDGTQGQAGAAGLHALVNVRPEPAGDECPVGGLAIESGLDRDEDGELAADEVEDTSYACNDGAGARAARVEIEDQLPGEACEAGGKRVDVGVDQDGDGSLDDGEVSETDYVCNGAPGERGKKGCGCSTPGVAAPPSGLLLLGILLLALAARTTTGRHRALK